MVIVMSIILTISKAVAGQMTLLRLVRDAINKNENESIINNNTTEMATRDRYDQETDIGRAIQMGTIVLICAFLPPLLIYCLTMKARKLLYRSQLLSKKIFEEKLKIAVENNHQSILKPTGATSSTFSAGKDQFHAKEKTSRL